MVGFFFGKSIRKLFREKTMRMRQLICQLVCPVDAYCATCVHCYLNVLFICYMYLLLFAEILLYAYSDI